jgi:hypothetical protein
VTQPASHLHDDALSAFVDQQLSPDESTQVVTHLQTCPECQDRLDGLRAVAALLRRLPEMEPPHDFSLGPRLLVDPPNVVRLRRWYTATRVAAGALVAAFVFMTAGALYVDSRSPARESVAVARPQALSASAAPTENLAPPPAARAAAPAQAPAASGAAAGAAAAPRPAAINPQADDQVAAATSVRPLPTPLPTPVPTPLLVANGARVVAESADPGALLRAGAVAVGALALAALLIAFVFRHRLQGASHT